LELGLDFLLHGHFLWGVSSWIIILLLILLSGLNGGHGIIIFLHVLISLMLLEVFPTEYLVLLSHVVIMESLKVHKSTALDEIVRLLLIVVLEVARHIRHVRHAGNCIEMLIEWLHVIGV